MNAWIVAALFGASLTGAGLGGATAALMHRYRTRQLNRCWSAAARDLCIDHNCANGEDPSS